MLSIHKELKYKDKNFIIGRDDFKKLTISPSLTQDDFYFFKYKNRLIYRFIFEERTRVDKCCYVTLIKKGNKFTPRFIFQIWNKTKKAYAEFKKKEISHTLIKASVNLDSCYENFWELINFINNFKDIDVGGSKLSMIDTTDKEIMEKFFGSEENKKNYIKERIKDGTIDDEDLINTGYRREQLKIFRKLFEEKHLIEYKKNVIKNEKIKDELAWQYFFNKNSWIFGYALDYRFMGILQKELSASGTEADGSGQVNVDFLLGDERFTTFVELKKPNTPLFGKVSGRSGTWKLSTSLMEAKSQILEQKASGQIKIEKENIHDSVGKEIKQKSYDSKVILIIGDWKQIKDDTDLTKKIKAKTFELFRRDSRNIEIITYDELYKRTKYIVEGVADDEENKK